MRGTASRDCTDDVPRPPLLDVDEYELTKLRGVLVWSPGTLKTWKFECQSGSEVYEAKISSGTMEP